MYYVYILTSLNFMNEIYIGYTTNIENRLKEHNQGKSFFTARHAPWKLKTYTAFTDKQKAINFELYLKSHSGRAFARKRFL